MQAAKVITGDSTESVADWINRISILMTMGDKVDALTELLDEHCPRADGTKAPMADKEGSAGTESSTSGGGGGGGGELGRSALPDSSSAATDTIGCDAPPTTPSGSWLNECGGDRSVRKDRNRSMGP